MFGAIAIYITAVFFIGSVVGDPTWWIHVAFWGYATWRLVELFTGNGGAANTHQLNAEVETVPCSTCDGTGSIMHTDWSTDSDGSQHPYHYEASCPHCAGSGHE